MSWCPKASRTITEQLWRMVSTSHCNSGIWNHELPFMGGHLMDSNRRLLFFFSKSAISATITYKKQKNKITQAQLVFFFYLLFSLNLFLLVSSSLLLVNGYYGGVIVPNNQSWKRWHGKDWTIMGLLEPNLVIKRVAVRLTYYLWKGTDELSLLRD